MSGGVSAVVSGEWLRERLGTHPPDRSQLCLLDVTWYSDKDAKQSFIQKHIVGARKFDLMHGVTQTELHPRNLPSCEVFEDYIRGFGVDNDTHVVVYDSEGRAGFFLGSRAWWMFKMFGLEKVSVLDGGLQKWEEKGFPVESGEEASPAKRGNFSSMVNREWLRSHDEIRKNLENRQFQVLDSRPKMTYLGKTDEPLTGHYPGAVNLPFAATLLDQETKTFKSPEILKEVFNSMGVDLEKPTVTMCNSGMSSCSLALAAHLAGANHVSVFHGGFTEWKTKSPDHIEKGEVHQD